MDYIWLCVGFFLGGIVAGFIAAGPQIIVNLFKTKETK